MAFCMNNECTLTAHCTWFK